MKSKNKEFIRNNLKENDEQVSFAGAVKQGLGKNQGLFFPETIPVLDNIDELLAMPLVERSVHVLYPFVKDDYALLKTAVSFGEGYGPKLIKKF